MAPSRFTVSIRGVPLVVVHGCVVALAGLALLSRAACTNGATPNCAGDAGCGPGIEASQLIDASGDAVDARAADAADAADAVTDVADASADATADATDAVDSGTDVGTHDGAAEGAADAPGDVAPTSG